MNRKIYKKIERYKEVERYSQNEIICNADINPIWNDIRIAYIAKLSEIGLVWRNER